MKTWKHVDLEHERRKIWRHEDLGKLSSRNTQTGIYEHLKLQRQGKDSDKLRSGLRHENLGTRTRQMKTWKHVDLDI